ncbi:MAG: Glycosyltransferase involved in cell wall bisynthesis [Chloroflexi bacterium AL-W]|nr:Glycosyltransferase involved in cell wall bisynthesis [Chloroflexi bacterium AL-N1]NOK64825.1 Glycosyltransferase involved in cell wall bisynthesis [Chloroflexi bacterium AL-N10]NOK76595.1 Glycosyltransferase involved in cell wall bisynthesis [Chloroflexi bacterium AL-N5]NOK80176.1 Glycosyltransferase involved in cell wall bisynthesis [Chloroflexi bacterium AL-W]NOK86689.1 Glycosyltransferase involved in cell wall bisynthesis [Chloroflexi bacterium AL-N15]
MNILFVAPYVPSPIRVRPYNFIRALARRGNNITLVCSTDKGDQAALAEMQSICTRVLTAPLGKAGMLWNAFCALPGHLPFQAALNNSSRLLTLVHTEARSRQHDVAHVEHLRASALGAELRGLPAVLDSVDCISMLFERTLRGSPSLKSRAMALVDLARTRTYEASYLTRYERVIISSPEDAWALEMLRTMQDQANEERTIAASPVTVIPNGVDLDYFAPQPRTRAPATIVFSGKMSYHANTAAALLLVQDIMPLVWERRPDARVVIAGSAPPREVQALDGDPRVTVTGYLPDLRPSIASATLAVCPLRYGVGIQNKVLEAMALATPSVVARQATQALQVIDGRDVFLAEQPHEYAQAILTLINDTWLATQIGQAGRRYVEQHHDWDSAAQQLEVVYRQAMARTNGKSSRREKMGMSDALGYTTERP